MAHGGRGRRPSALAVSAVVVVAAVGAVAGAGLRWGRDPASGDPTPGVVFGRTDQCHDARATDARQAAVCDGVWLRPARRAFVPQGLVVTGRTAYVSGYRDGRIGHRLCQVVVADAETGRTRTYLRQLTGTLGGVPVQCRHGGGLARSPEGLWLAATSRLWLLDPAALRAGGDPVLRVWAVEAPVRGSALVARRGRLGLVGWAERRPHRVFWTEVDDLMADGVQRVSVSGGPGAARPSSRHGVPSRTQGGAWGPGGLWLSRSTTYCGELVRPDGRRTAFLPGAEGVAFARGRLWVVSESGSRAYQRLGGGRPAVPTLLALDPQRLDPAADLCPWD